MIFSISSRFLQSKINFSPWVLFLKLLYSVRPFQWCNTHPCTPKYFSYDKSRGASSRYTFCQFRGSRFNFSTQVLNLKLFYSLRPFQWCITHPSTPNFFSYGKSRRALIRTKLWAKMAEGSRGQKILKKKSAYYLAQWSTPVRWAKLK